MQEALEELLGLTKIPTNLLPFKRASNPATEENHSSLSLFLWPHVHMFRPTQADRGSPVERSGAGQLEGAGAASQLLLLFPSLGSVEDCLREPAVGLSTK